jgi:hypothetical protein
MEGRLKAVTSFVPHAVQLMVQLEHSLREAAAHKSTHPASTPDAMPKRRLLVLRPLEEETAHKVQARQAVPILIPTTTASGGRN